MDSWIPPTTQLPPLGAHDRLYLEGSLTRMSLVTAWLHPPASLSACPTRHPHPRCRAQACSTPPSPLSGHLWALHIQVASTSWPGASSPSPSPPKMSGKNPREVGVTLLSCPVLKALARGGHELASSSVQAQALEAWLSHPITSAFEVRGSPHLRVRQYPGAWCSAGPAWLESKGWQQRGPGVLGLSSPLWAISCSQILFGPSTAGLLPGLRALSHT